jgi:SAM-dependent methyltransferase
MSIAEHYRALLASRYTWMMGGPECCLAAARELLNSVGLLTFRSGAALDLGCGAGYHARVLAEAGMQVIAVDDSADLLREAAHVCKGFNVVPVQSELSDSRQYAAHGPFSVVLCIGDTLTHLGSRLAVDELLASAARLLTPGGVLLLEFREQPRDLAGEAAVLTLRAERDRIMQCVLHFEPERVWVTDVVHEWMGSRWETIKSTYPKLRLRAADILACAAAAGLTVKGDSTHAGRRVLAFSS